MIEESNRPRLLLLPPSPLPHPPPHPLTMRTLIVIGKPMTTNSDITPFPLPSNFNFGFFTREPSAFLCWPFLITFCTCRHLVQFASLQGGGASCYSDGSVGQCCSSFRKEKKKLFYLNPLPLVEKGGGLHILHRRGHGLKWGTLSLVVPSLFFPPSSLGSGVIRAEEDDFTQRRRAQKEKSQGCCDILKTGQTFENPFSLILP